MSVTPRPRPLSLPPMALFAAATLLPAGLLLAGPAGGLWAAAALVWMTVLAAVLDQCAPLVAPEASEGTEFPAADPLLVAIAALHLAVLPVTVRAVAGDGALSGVERAALFLGAGLWIGQVAVPAAHELIHRGNRRLYWLGVAIYASILFGHHASAHRLVHHRHAASADDPNTARIGESFYRFALRAWRGSFRQGWRAEAALRRGTGLHPYAVYAAGSLLALALAFALAGVWGVLVWTGLALHAQAQLLLADYVQHYGLERARGPDGRLEPVGLRHSWNAPHWFSGGMMLHAPRHSDHHAHPARPYPSLRLADLAEAPRLPCALPVACTIALVPPLWRRMIHPRLAGWRDPR